MSSCRFHRLLGHCLMAVGSTALGQVVESGLEKDKPAPALKVFDTTGANEGKEVDSRCEKK